MVTKMKAKKILTVLLFIWFVLTFAENCVILGATLNPVRFDGICAEIENYDNKDEFNWAINNYSNVENTVYSNDKCRFDSKDMSDYCKVRVDINAVNHTYFDSYFDYIYPVSDNDFIVCVQDSVKSSALHPNDLVTCGSVFICKRNGRTDEEIVKALSELNFKVHYTRKIFGETDKKVDAQGIYLHKEP